MLARDTVSPMGPSLSICRRLSARTLLGLLAGSLTLAAAARAEAAALSKVHLTPSFETAGVIV